VLWKSRCNLAYALDGEVLGVVTLNIDLAKATPNRIPDFLVGECLVVGVRARAITTINYSVNRMADDTGLCSGYRRSIGSTAGGS
jgi:hypothetical protein